ncbi:MAG: hydantoinase B/oxoprolinase family protein [Chloroflexi bacterium]|nr:hydantoinase B/oxoprolinase family protein [Chloroflexota bacterium]
MANTRNRKTIDPITLEVVNSATEQIIRQLTINMLRTGYSTIVKEMQDVTFAILDEEGRLVGQAFVAPLHLGVICAQTVGIIERYRGNMKPGDCFVVNHPYMVCQNHSSDITLISPIFYRERIVGYVGNTAHKPDIGGKVPGSVSGDSTDLFQDGLLIPPLKLYREGVLNEDLAEMIRCNSRTPEITWGDTKAQALTNSYGVAKIGELMDRFGTDTVVGCWREWIDICEKEMRRRISLVPDGVYGPITDYMDDDGIQLDKPFHITVTLEKKGDRLHLIFDSAEQARGPINIRPCLTACAAQYCVKAVLAPDLPNNHGSFLPVQFTFPAEGNFLNPRFPASINMYAMVVGRICATVMMVLAQALPDRVPAPASGGGGAFSFSGPHPRTGRWYSQYELPTGGYGARPTKDGVSSMDADALNVLNTPVETVETEFPVMIERYELVQDSGGAGKYRGGLGARRDWRILSDEVVFTLRSDRFKFSSPGIFGAKPAKPSRCLLNPDTDRERALHSKVSNLRLHRGDVVRCELAGGGGWGDPMEREPQRVLKDVVEGYVSIESARKEYGVAIDSQTFTIDVEETTMLRGGRDL